MATCSWCKNELPTHDYITVVDYGDVDFYCCLDCFVKDKESDIIEILEDNYWIGEKN